jgi:hypothetical protein
LTTKPTIPPVMVLKPAMAVAWYTEGMELALDLHGAGGKGELKNQIESGENIWT